MRTGSFKSVLLSTLLVTSLIASLSIATLISTSQTASAQESFIKECMPDLGQHCENWCWCAAAANSIWWYATHGYPELLDDPSTPGLDNDYLQIIPWPGCPSPEGGFRRLLHEIAIDCLGLPDGAPPDETYCHSIDDDSYFYGLRKFMEDQGTLLFVHEIVDPAWVFPIPPETEIGVEYRKPLFEDYERELGRCQDVLLWLLVVREEPYPYERMHVVTGVGWDKTQGMMGSIIVSDPWTTGAPDHNNDNENKNYDEYLLLPPDALGIPFKFEYGEERDENAYVVKMIFVSPNTLYLDNLENLENPVCSWLHELYPEYCRWHHIENWYDDNEDGVLGACDTIILWNENTGERGWYHVDNVTITLYVEGEYENLYLDLPPENFKDWDYIKTNPVCTWWHEIWPLFCYRWHLVNWWDSGDGVLSYCDNIELEGEGGYRENFHVEKVKYDIIVTEIPPPSIPGVDVEIDPEYQSGMPGETLYYTVWVTNTGNFQDTYDLENSDTNGWTLSLSKNTVGPLDPGTSENVTLTVTIPEDTPYCTTDNITVTATSQTDPEVSDSDSCIAHQDYYIKECMPDLGQHCINWCWAAAAANSIKWWAEYRGYIELLDDPENAVFPDNNYLQLLPCPWCGNLPRLLHEIAIDCLGLPDDAPIEATWCTPVTDNQFYYGLQKFINEQGAPLYVHEILNPDNFAPGTVPLEDGENVIYDNVTFENYKSELLRCQDVLLQLSFNNAGYESDPYGEEALDHIVTGVSFFDGGPGNQWIEVADPWTPFPWPGPPWGPDHNNDQTRYTYEVLPVLSEDPLIVLYTGEAFGVSVVQPTQVIKLIYISPEVVENWTGTATFRLENLYKVSLEKDLQLYAGSKLVVKFYKYDNITLQAQSVIDNWVTTPKQVKENENVPHPRGAEGFSWGTVQIATLVLTTDNENEVISTIASLTVHQSDLRNRNKTILKDWAGNPGLWSAFRLEIKDILKQWASAPP